MKSVIYLALKDLKLISRDWLGLIFIVGFPICMGVFFGMVGVQMSEGPTKTRLAVIDEDKTEYSQRFIELLRDDDNLEIELCEKEDALEQVRRGKRVGALILPIGFGEKAGVLWSPEPAKLQMATDPSRQAEAGMLEGYVMKAMGQMVGDRFQDVDSMRPMIEDSKSQIAAAEDLNPVQKLLLNQLMTSLDGFLDSMQEVQQNDDENATGDMLGENAPDFQFAEIERIEVAKPTGSASSLVSRIQSPWDISFPSAILWGVLGSAAGFAISIVRERTHGTLLRLQIAPITRSQLLIGKATACFLTVVSVVVLLIGIGMALGMRPNNFAMLTVATVSIAFCYVGLMMIMSVIGKSEEAVAGASWGINVLTAMFGGAMIPLAFMPSIMKSLSNFSPVKWSILSLEGAIWRDFTWGELLIPCGILVAIGAVGFTIGCIVLSRE